MEIITQNCNEYVVNNLSVFSTEQGVKTDKDAKKICDWE
jgi:hypothetical protein